MGTVVTETEERMIGVYMTKLTGHLRDMTGAGLIPKVGTSLVSITKIETGQCQSLWAL